MTERALFPSPPGKSAVINRDGTMSLGWLNWFGALAAWVQRVRVISTAVDLPSIPAGGAAFAQVTVANARLGDFVIASLDPADRDIAVAAQVTADNEVTVWAHNYSGSAIDLAAGTLRIRLEKAR